jgi:hypothetical protein
MSGAQRISGSSPAAAVVATNDEPQGDNNFGASNLEKKLEMADSMNDSTLETLVEMGTYVRNFIVKDVPGGTKYALNVVKEGLTPGFVRRMKNRKIYVKTADNSEQ